MVWAADSLSYQSSGWREGADLQSREDLVTFRAGPTSAFFQSVALNKLCEFWQVAPSLSASLHAGEFRRLLNGNRRAISPAPSLPSRWPHTLPRSHGPIWLLAPCAQTSPLQSHSGPAPEEGLLPAPPPKSASVPHGCLARFPRSFLLAS